MSEENSSVPSHDPRNYGPTPAGAPEPGTLCYVRVKVRGYHKPWRGIPPDVEVEPVTKGGLPFHVRGLCPVLIVPPEILVEAKMAVEEQGLYVNKEPESVS